MEKQSLTSIIDKYYLNGIGEKVKWTVKDNTVTIKTFSPTKDMVGVVTAPFEFPDSEFVIFDTSKFLKLVGICNQFLTMDIQLEGKIATKLLLADSEYNLEYALANLMLAPNVNFTVSEFESDYCLPLNPSIPKVPPLKSRINSCNPTGNIRKNIGTRLNLFGKINLFPYEPNLMQLNLVINDRPASTTTSFATCSGVNVGTSVSRSTFTADLNK